VPFTIDTGVTRQRINLLPPPGCDRCPAIGPLEGGRGFDVPSLVGVRDTAPFFHDNSAATLRQAVAFYGSPSFNESPAAQLVGPIALWPEAIDDLTAFLEELTACGNGVVDRGESCDDGNVRDGDCCSATCTTEATSGSACDDGNPCTSAAECRNGVCIALDRGPCGLDGCAEPGAIVPSMVTCAVTSLGERASGCVADGGRIERGLGRGMRLVESALRDGASPRDRRALKKAAAAFRAAARRAVGKGGACESDVVSAIREAQVRALCVRRCVAERGTPDLL
jgi:cysteine-rich repeat protein